MSGFPIDTLVDSNELCNLESELDQLFKFAKDGHRVVIFGRRNTGKTSLILNGVIPSVRTHYKNKKSCNIFVDFMGIETEQDATIRLRRGIEAGLKQAFPLKQNFKSMIDVAGRLRPSVSTDPITGELSITVITESSSGTGSITDLILSLADIHAKVPVFLVFDEFQDISAVRSLAAIFRGALQQLPNDLPVFVCGSKKHLLASMFARHKAPFAGWGRDFVIPTVETEHYINAYLQYANERLAVTGKSLAPSAFKTLVQLCDGIPESLNIVLDHIYRNSLFEGKIDDEKVRLAIVDVIDSRRSRFEEMMLRFSSVEQNILIAIAKKGPIEKPKGKDFLQQNPGLSPTAVFSNVQRLEQEADIYRNKSGFVLSDPLLSIYLQRFR